MVATTRAEKKNRNWLIVAGAAFLIQGGWTLGVNSPHGIDLAWPPALMQGVISGFSAGGMTLIMEWVFRVLPPSPVRPIASVVGTSLVMAGFLHVSHRIMGTPEIAATLFLPMVAVVLYATVYTLKLTRRGGRAAAAD